MDWRPGWWTGFVIHVSPSKYSRYLSASFSKGAWDAPVSCYYSNSSILHWPDTGGRGCCSLRCKPRLSVTRICGLITRRLPGSATRVPALPRSSKVSSWFPGLWFPTRLSHGLLKRGRLVVRGQGVEVSLWTPGWVCGVRVKIPCALCHRMISGEAGAWVQEHFRLVLDRICEESN